MDKFIENRFRNRVLLITNLITAILLAILLIVNKYPQRTYKKIDAYLNNKPLLTPHSFLDNENYVEQTDFYTAYVGQKNIVMLGNSITYRINWAELLNRTDVANRGIGSDITGGYINRLAYVLNLKPKICFIEGGVNDLAFNISQDTTVKNLNALVDTLLKNKIRPILTTVAFVTSSYPEAKTFNQQINMLNQRIVSLAAKKNISFIDLNTRLAKDGFLDSKYAFSDGIHFTSKAYLVWKEEIVKILNSEKL